jgi:hypothetical protein
MDFNIHYLYFVFVIFLVVFGSTRLDLLFKKRLKMNSMEDGRIAFDPASLGDSVAILTDWTPAKGGGANFRTHKLVTVTPYRMEFRASKKTKLIWIIFLLISLGLFIHFSFTITSFCKGDLDNFSISCSGKVALDDLLFSFVFAGIARKAKLYLETPIVFDKTKGAFWKGRKPLELVFNKASLDYFAKLNQVHALQLISEYCRESKSSFHSYELNLVLKNGQRINVVDHGNKDRLRDDAASLSAFLQKPVWDATYLNGLETFNKQVQCMREP